LLAKRSAAVVSSAGRTDRGVSALGQLLSFQSWQPLTHEAISLCLLCHLTMLTMAISLCLLWPSQYAYNAISLCLLWPSHYAYYGHLTMLTMLTMPSHYAYIGHLTVLTMAISLCLLWPSHCAYYGHLTMLTVAILLAMLTMLTMLTMGARTRPSPMGRARLISPARAG
jgi:hypothetical protein